MKVIVCLDDAGGMLFHNRRQSQDRGLREELLNNLGKARLWMNAYSFGQFREAGQGNLTVDEAFLDKASKDAYCFVEDQQLKPYESEISELIIYRWNRKYPADLFFDLDLTDWHLVDTRDFAGSSHQRITKEEYRKS